MVGIMSKIKFNKETTFVGRNGTGKCVVYFSTGIPVSSLSIPSHPRTKEQSVTIPTEDIDAVCTQLEASLLSLVLKNTPRQQLPLLLELHEQLDALIGLEMSR